MQSISKVSAVQTRSAALGQFKKRWLHGSLKRQASIRMPYMSPMMTEGTITKWNKKEGEAFAAGDVLLQIHSDFYSVDVEAQSDGILGKIIMPEGSLNVPVEQVIALVARDSTELALLQSGQSLPSPSISVPPTPAYNPIPDPPSVSANPMSTGLASPRQFAAPLSSPRTPVTMLSRTPRTPSLFEMHSVGQGHRSMHVGGPSVKPHRPAKLRIPRLEALSGIESPDTPSTARASTPMSASIPSPFRMQLGKDVSTTPFPSTPSSAKWPVSAPGHPSFGPAETQDDGATLRRMIVSNLSSNQTLKSVDLDEFL